MKYGFLKKKAALAAFIKKRAARYPVIVSAAFQQVCPPYTEALVGLFLLYRIYRIYRRLCIVSELEKVHSMARNLFALLLHKMPCTLKHQRFTAAVDVGLQFAHDG